MSVVATETFKVTRQTLKGVFVQANGLTGLNGDLLGPLKFPQVFRNSISDGPTGQQGDRKQGLNSAAVILTLKWIIRIHSGFILKFHDTLSRP